MGLVGCVRITSRPDNNIRRTIVARGFQFERYSEGEVFFFGCSEINCLRTGHRIYDVEKGMTSCGWKAYLDTTGISDNGLEVDGVNQRFPESNILDTGVIETPNIVPDYHRPHNISKS